MTATVSTAVRTSPLALEPAVGGAQHAVRTLLVGTGRRAANIARALTAQGRRVIGAVDQEPMPHLRAAMPDVPWLGPLADIGTLAVTHAADEICIALPLRSCFDECVRARAVAGELGIPVAFDLDILGDAAPARLAAMLDGTLVRCNLHPTSFGWVPIAKRVFDVLGASLALIVLSPLLIGVAIVVKLTSRGPILFRQPRVGRGRRVFGMLKFRTMVQDAEQRRGEVEALNVATGIMFKVARDPRLTSVGPLLRRTSIDELPQLFNVLRGDMSLVGPRPIPTWVYAQIDEPPFHRRFSVLPGLTGLWQVHGRPQEYPLMVRYDLAYVDQWSFWLDLKILARTVPAVLRRQGAQ